MAGHRKDSAAHKENRRRYEEKCAELGGRRPASGIPSGGPASGIPAHPGHRPPTGWDWLTHGASSPAIVSEVAERLRAELLAARPDLAGPSFAAALAAWSVAEARCALLRNYSDDVGLLDPDTGEPLPFVVLSERVEARAAKARAVLGLDPRSSAALARERAEASGSVVSLAALAEAGRQALDSRTIGTSPLELEAGSDSAEGHDDHHRDEEVLP